MERELVKRCTGSIDPVLCARSLEDLERSLKCGRRRLLGFVCGLKRSRIDQDSSRQQLAIPFFAEFHRISEGFGCKLSISSMRVDTPQDS